MLGTGGLVAMYLVTARILRAVSPEFGKLAAVEAKLEGDFRSAHSRVITNAEEIAFYNGGHRELQFADRSYQTLIRHVNRIFTKRIIHNALEDFLVKYTWSAVGLGVCSLSVFFPRWVTSIFGTELVGVSATAGGANTTASPVGTVTGNENQRSGSRTQDFITNKRFVCNQFLLLLLACLFCLIFFFSPAQF